MKRNGLWHFLGAVFIQSIVSTAHGDVLDNWTTNQISTNADAFHHVAYGNGIYVAVGQYSDSGTFYTSADGLHWELQHTEPNSWGVSLNYSGDRFIGVASGFSVADISLDGTNWSTAFLNIGPPYYNFIPTAITYGNGLYAVVGYTNNNIASILTSPDGITWTYRKAGTIPGGPLSSIAYGVVPFFPGTQPWFVAMGNNDGYFYTSSTGSSWTRRNIAGGSLVSYANGLFFVPFNNKTNLLSADGVNWSQQPTGLTNMLGAVTYGNGIFMAQCGISRSGCYLATSTDGTNWFQYPKLLPNYCPIFDTSDFDVSVATDGTRLVTGGGITNNGLFSWYNGFIYTSDPLVEIRMTNNSTPKAAISGLVGRNYQIQSTDALGAGNNWRTNATIQLTNTPFVWTDTNTTNSARFYRGVLLP